MKKKIFLSYLIQTVTILRVVCHCVSARSYCLPLFLYARLAKSGKRLTWLLISFFVEITLVTPKPEKLAPSRQDIFQGMFL